jgi:hypothetical protein
MLNPSVGEIWEISSPASFLRIVVFPALSRPLQSLVTASGRPEQLHLLPLLLWRRGSSSLAAEE